MQVFNVNDELNYELYFNGKQKFYRNLMYSENIYFKGNIIK